MTCSQCSTGELCDPGHALLHAMLAARADLEAFPATARVQGAFLRAKAAWMEHRDGYWGDASPDDTARLTSEEEHALSEVRKRYAALIGERAKR